MAGRRRPTGLIQHCEYLTSPGSIEDSADTHIRASPHAVLMMFSVGSIQSEEISHPIGPLNYHIK